MGSRSLLEASREGENVGFVFRLCVLAVLVAAAWTVISSGALASVTGS